MSYLPMVTLRNGSQIPMQTAVTTMKNFKDLRRESPNAFYELIALCKDPNHKIADSHTPYYNARSILTDRMLMDLRGRVYDDVKQVVLNSIEGEGITLRIVNPLKKDTEAT